VTYAKKLSKEEAQLDWRLSAAQLERNVRAFNPWPIAWLTTATGQVVKVWRAEVCKGDSNKAAGTVLRADKQGIVVQTADAALSITELQPPGKKPMPVSDFLNGRSEWFAEHSVLPGVAHE